MTGSGSYTGSTIDVTHRTRTRLDASPRGPVVPWQGRVSHGVIAELARLRDRQIRKHGGIRLPWAVRRGFVVPSAQAANPVASSSSAPRGLPGLTGYVAPDEHRSMAGPAGPPKVRQPSSQASNGPIRRVVREGCALSFFASAMVIAPGRPGSAPPSPRPRDAVRKGRLTLGVDPTRFDTEASLQLPGRDPHPLGMTSLGSIAI